MSSPDFAIQTRAVEHQISAVLTEREAKIINELVNNYRRNKIDYEYLLSKIAIISELRTLKDAFHRETLDAIDEVEDNYGRGTGHED